MTMVGEWGDKLNNLGSIHIKYFNNIYGVLLFMSNMSNSEKIFPIFIIENQLMRLWEFCDKYCFVVTLYRRLYHTPNNPIIRFSMATIQSVHRDK